ncbi:MAG: hypothetical protein GY854_04570 [Deltaproteobacteria bacterium]|nr:hypothetical protein [Deltaproteobacteria bacterium]
MTANTMAGDREKCVASGMDDYISKPVSKNDLENAIIAWQGKTSPCIDDRECTFS